MSWIKRNLYFVIGSGVAVILMGLAGYSLSSKWDLNNTYVKSLEDEYGELDNLNKQNPHPGSGKVDNIQLAKEQRKELAEFIRKSRSFFQRIPAIPDSPKLTDREFSPALSRTIAQLQREATNASVSLQPRYAFSFQAQLSQFNFSSGSLAPLSVQLGEVKIICDVLFQAKINWLDSIRREMVSSNDAAGAQTDYIVQPSVTNELAVLSPYEVSFRCFSSELASVLAGFASSPYGILVQSINVDQAQAESLAMGMSAPGMVAPQQQIYVPPPPPPPARSAEDAFAARYGRRGPSAPAPAYTAPAVTAVAGPANKGGLQTVLDEKLLKVTLNLQVVKLLPSK
jgi:hypothetical protein